VHISQRWFPAKQNIYCKAQLWSHGLAICCVTRAQTIGEAPRNFGNAIFT
jgi:hypothetical protein